MRVVGLTGSIGMGKSTVAAALGDRGIPVCDADKLVHDLYDKEAVPAIEEAFPGTTGPDGVDRSKLSSALMRDPSGFSRLEAIVHPLVRKAQARFLRGAAAAGAEIAVLEIPLLFETSAHERLDAVIVVSAPQQVQQARVLERPGMTEDKFAQILARQTPDEDKRRRADFIVDTGCPLPETLAQVDKLVSRLEALPKGTAYHRHWLEA